MWTRNTGVNPYSSTISVLGSLTCITSMTLYMGPCWMSHLKDDYMLIESKDSSARDRPVINNLIWYCTPSHHVNLISVCCEFPSLTKISNSIFQLEFFQDWELAQNQLDTIGFSWTFFQLILDLFGLDWTFSQLDKIGSNWTFPIGNILRGEIYNWKKHPTNSNSLKSNQLCPTEFIIGLSWSQILLELEIQYSNINQLTPTQYQLNPIHSNWISNWNELANLLRDVTRQHGQGASA